MEAQLTFWFRAHDLSRDKIVDFLVRRVFLAAVMGVVEGKVLIEWVVRVLSDGYIWWYIEGSEVDQSDSSAAQEDRPKVEVAG